MLRFQIPQSFLPGFEHLISLAPEQVEQLTAFIETMPVGTGVNNFIKVLSSGMNDESKSMKQLAATLYSLGSLQSVERTNSSDDELAKNLAESFQAQQDKDKKLSDEQVQTLHSYLLAIFQASQPLLSTYKALRLLAENNMVLRDAHVVTDIRLVFKDDLETAERHGLIIHQLKIEAEVDYETSDFYFSLSHADLLRLKEQVDRAIKKEESIKQGYSNAIDFIQITE